MNCWGKFPRSMFFIVSPFILRRYSSKSMIWTLICAPPLFSCTLMLIEKETSSWREMRQLRKSVSQTGIPNSSLPNIIVVGNITKLKTARYSKTPWLEWRSGVSKPQSYCASVWNFFDIQNYDELFRYDSSVMNWPPDDLTPKHQTSAPRAWKSRSVGTLFARWFENFAAAVVVAGHCTMPPETLLA